MSLGETIYRLRTEKNLSQGDLAERLEVSRQSVSKWENDSAVPDLAKIVKLSELFEVSLDELVKGERTPERGYNAVLQDENESSKMEVKSGYNNVQANVQTGFPGRKIAGTILFCMAFLVALLILIASGSLLGVIVALPFLICGMICFAVKKHVGLWCAWAIYLLTDIYLAFATGISRISILYVVRYMFHWTVGTIVALVLFLGLAALIVITALCLGKVPLASLIKGKKQMLTAWIAWIGLHLVAFLFGHSAVFRYITEHMGLLWGVYALISVVLNWVRVLAFTVAAVATVRYVKSKKATDI